MEHWAIYNVETGAFLWGGSGPAGYAALQPLPEGAALALVPMAALATPGQVNLEPLRSAAEADLDAQADQLAQKFITPGIRKALTYPRKEAEARAWLASGQPDTVAGPFLSKEAAARGMTVPDLAMEVIQRSDAWAAIGSEIEARTQGAKAALAAAATVGAIVAASRIDWSDLAA